jgi:hypothetical protein
MITAARLRELLHYDQETGLFTWRVDKGYRIKAGDPAGHDNWHGYLRVRVDGKVYYLHRLAWLYVHGVWPAQEIDHINGVRDDNRIENLREATAKQNSANTRRSRRNKSGVKGVHWVARLGKWRATIRICGFNRCLGCFEQLEDAAAAYRVAAEAQFGEFYRMDGGENEPTSLRDTSGDL